MLVRCAQVAQQALFHQTVQSCLLPVGTISSNSKNSDIVIFQTRLSFCAHIETASYFLQFDECYYHNSQFCKTFLLQDSTGKSTGNPNFSKKLQLQVYGNLFLILTFFFHSSRQKFGCFSNIFPDGARLHHNQGAPSQESPELVQPTKKVERGDEQVAYFVSNAHRTVISLYLWRQNFTQNTNLKSIKINT